MQRKGDLRLLLEGGGGECTEWEIKRQRKRVNLDEKEELAEAGQQRQKASEDTVVHIPELWK